MTGSVGLVAWGMVAAVWVWVYHSLRVHPGDAAVSKREAERDLADAVLAVYPSGARGADGV